MLPPNLCSALAVLDIHIASLGLSFWQFFPIARRAELGSDRIDSSTVKLKRQYLLYKFSLCGSIMLLTSWADCSPDVFRETFRGGGACVESGDDRFRLLEGAVFVSSRNGGVDGGVSNVSSEEEHGSTPVKSRALRAFATSEGIIGESSNASALAKISTISWSG